MAKETLAKLNPVSYAIDSARMLFEGGIPVYGIISLAIGAGVILLIGTYQFRKAVV